jgi:nitrogen fixation/metabolism regulation signal transduction histidine kinase
MPSPFSRYFLRLRALVLMVTTIAITTATLLFVQTHVTSPVEVLVGTFLLATPLAVGTALTLTRPIRRILFAVSEGLLGFRERDYGLRLVAERDDEAGEVVRRFNALGEMLRREHNDAYQKQILFETVIQAAPMAIVLCNEAGTVILANVCARELFFAGKRLQGHDFADLLADWPQEIASAILTGQDNLVSIERDGVRETLHSSRRFFELNTQPHVLHIVKPLSRELARQETEVWKKTIRVISHELNNSLAPITSLVHSARTIAGRPEHAHRLDEVFVTIEERTTHLKAFLDGYARFARLPKPSKQHAAWKDLLSSVRALYSFEVPGELPQEPGYYDPGQMQQVLINLVKNAAEAGSAREAVEVEVRSVSGGSELRVMDRGHGMTDEVLEKALLPFYSTKKGGSGLGLPLCREIVESHGGLLSIERREGGGTLVRCFLPSATEAKAPLSTPPLASSARGGVQPQRGA